jgi:L-methionine (R)-S-oxide reductase
MGCSAPFAYPVRYECNKHLWKSSQGTRRRLGLAYDGLWKADGTRENMTNVHQELLDELKKYAVTAPTAEALMERTARRLHEKMTRYNWVGFYLTDPTSANFLIVGPFAGSFTPNVRIPLNSGLCGAAASSGQVIVVQDVSTDQRYLAGSALVKSEIVAPIFVSKKKFVGELDIESYFTDTFNDSERTFVEACAELVANYLGKG